MCPPASPVSSCHPPTQHSIHIFQWDAPFPSSHTQEYAVLPFGISETIFFVLPFWVCETETETTAVPVFAERICFNPVVCLIYQSFRCDTCKAQPRIIFQWAGKNPIGKWVSFFPLFLFWCSKADFQKKMPKNISAQRVSLVCLALRCEYFYMASNLLFCSNSFFFIGLFSCSAQRLQMVHKDF